MKDSILLRIKSRLLLFALLTFVVGVSPAWAQKTLPYTYGFEDYNLATDGWTTYFGTTLTKNNNECAIVGAAKKTGSYGFRFSSYNTSGANAQYLISPELNAPNGVELTFEYKATNSSGTETFKVGYSTTGTDISSFTFGDEYSTKSTSWTTFEGTFPAGTKYIAVYYYANFQYRLYVDDFSFSAPATCIKPTGLTVDDIDSHSVTLSWTSDGDAWNVQYKKATETEWTDVSGTVTVNPYTLSGLTPGTAYQARVRTYCSATDQSNWTDAVSFTTDCATLTIDADNSYSQDFSDVSTLPTCWSRNNENISSGSGWYVSSGWAVSGYYGDAYLIMPSLKLGSNDVLTFDNKFNYMSDYDKSSVVLSTTGTAAADFTTTLYTFEKSELPNSSETVLSKEISLAAYAGKTVYIAFKYEGNYAHSWSIDNVVVEQGPAYPSPKDLTASDLTSEGATLSWTAVGTETAWQVVYSTEADFDPNAATPIDVAETSYTFTGLTPSTTYYVAVRAKVDDENYSEWTATSSFRTTPAAVSAAGFTDDFEADNGWDFINGTLTNAWTRGTATNNGGTAAMYISNDGGTSNAYTTSGATAVYATKLFSFAEGNYVISYDWKANGESNYDYLRVALAPASVEFEAGTSLYSGIATSALPEGWIALDGGSKLNLSSEWAKKETEITIDEPVSYYVVFVWRNDGASGSQEPAAIDNFSIVQDLYPKPTELTATNVDGTSALLNWTENGTATAWQVVYSTDANFDKDAATPVDAGEMPFTLTGLNALTTYYMAVRADMGNGNYSRWSPICTLTVLDPSKWYADFEDGWPAGSVYQSNVSRSNLGSNSEPNYALNGAYATTNNIFITPKLRATAGEKLQFDARIYGSTWNSQVKVYAAATREEVLNAEDGTTRTQVLDVSRDDEVNSMTEDFQTYEVNALEGDYYYGFEFTERPYVDNIYGLTPASVHDWTISSNSIPTEAMQNVAAEATVSILNLGMQDEAADSYTVTAYVNDEAAGNGTAVALPMGHLLTNAGTQLSVSFLYPKAGTFPVYIKVEADGYSVQTEAVDVTFAAEEVIPNVIEVGTKTSSASKDNAIIDFYNLDGGALTSDILYTAAQLKAFSIATGDKITKLAFKGTVTAEKTINNTLTVWYGLSTGDITYNSPDKTAMTEVTLFEGTTLVSGVNEFAITLPTPLVYDGTSDLRIYFEGTQGSWANITFDYDDNYQNMKWSNGLNMKGNPLLYVTLAVEPATLAGTVTDGSDPVEGATVTLTSEDGDHVQYTGTTAADGSYSIKVLQTTRTYTIVASKDDAKATQTNVSDFSTSIDLVLLPNLTISEATDNSETLTTYDGQSVNVTLTRTLQAGGWNTFCVPFNLDTPAGWTVKELTGSELAEGMLTLTFNTAESIVAGKPYLVKVTDAVANPTFDDVEIVNETTTTETDFADFVPVMNPTFLTGGNKSVLFVTGGNKLTYPTADGNINGLRAYFQLKGDAVSLARVFRMSFDDDVTGIEIVLSDEPTTASGIYMLDGRRIEGKPTQKGVYIVNGKKIIIK